MADNYVEIRIKADDTAKPDLTELKLDLDELGRKIETARVDVDDEDGKAKLLAFNARLAAINKRVASARITVAGAARAEADIAAVDAGLKHLNGETAKLDEKANQNSGRGGLLGKLLFGAAGDAGGLGGDAGGAGGAGTPLLEAIPAAGAAAAVAIPVIGAVLTEVTGLVSGLAAAGAGAGAFAALTLPAFNAVKGALGDTHAQMMKLPVDERDAVAGIKGLEYEFGKLSTAFQPEVFKIFNDALGIAYHLLPTITPFADAFAGALDGLLKQVGKFTESKGFKDWLAQFQKLTGPSLTAIGVGIGHVVAAFGKLLTTMSAKDVVNAINIAFSILTGTINAVTFVVRGLMRAWDTYSSAARHVASDTVSDARNVATAFDNVRHAAADLAHNVAAHWDEIRHDTANLAHNIASYFDEARANIHRVVSATINDIRQNWKLIIAIILGPLGLAIDAAVTHIRGLETAFRVVFAAISSIVKEKVAEARAILAPFAAWLAPLFKGAWSAVVAVWHWAFGSMQSTASGGVSKIHGILNWFSGLAGMFLRWWDAALSAVTGAIGRLIGVVRTIPGRINSALGNLPSMLFRAGVNAIEGLIRGMGSMVGSAMNMAAGWGHDIVNALGSAFGIHFSEPSEASKMVAAGKQIPRGLATGMLSGTGALRSAATTVSGAAYPHTGGGAARGGGGPITLNITGSDSSVVKALVLALRREIRVQGGNVQTVLGH